MFAFQMVLATILKQKKHSSTKVLMSEDVYTMLDETPVTQKENCNNELITEIDDLEVLIVSRPGDKKIENYIKVI